MSVCPSCKSDGAYILFNLAHCSNKECRNYKPPSTGNRARVAWKVNGVKGYSKWMSIAEAHKRAKKGLKDYGKGTHWIEREGAEGFLWMYDQR